MTHSNQVMITFKCNCGYRRWGTVMDDPSCVIDTAQSVLQERIARHFKQQLSACWTYEATIDPLGQDLETK